MHLQFRLRISEEKGIDSMPCWGALQLARHQQMVNFTQSAWIHRGSVEELNVRQKGLRFVGKAGEQFSKMADGER